eukprot:Hpha_TRINITY_DN27306_c0_g1::TRINITY_DN27306_c0_g1_i1::g.556::m.556
MPPRKKLAPVQANTLTACWFVKRAAEVLKEAERCPTPKRPRVSEGDVETPVAQTQDADQSAERPSRSLSSSPPPRPPSPPQPSPPCDLVAAAAATDRAVDAPLPPSEERTDGAAPFAAVLLRERKPDPAWERLREKAAKQSLSVGEFEQYRDYRRHVSKMEGEGRTPWRFTAWRLALWRKEEDEGANAS